MYVHLTVGQTVRLCLKYPFVNRNSGICHVSYQKDGREYKDRWYDTIGKRTYNAIVETARCAGYAI